jgi:arabinoxylan arabinofuranohydrolase
MIKSIKFQLLLILLFTIFANGTFAQESKPEAYLFTYFTGNGQSEEAIHYATSENGYNWKALNYDEPIISSAKISTTGGVRDPHILRGEDGKTFYMVATDMQVAKNGWGPNFAMVMMKSKDLINWTSQVVDIAKTFKEFKDVNRVWAPQTIYDKLKNKYLLYWSMRFGNGPDKIYYAYAKKDFSGLETLPEQLFISPTNSACIDGDIIYKDGIYNLFFKTEGAGNGIKKAISNQINAGYVLQDKFLQQTTDPVEGAGVFKLNNSGDYILMYDLYTKGKYQFTRSNDLENFTVVDQNVTMDFHPRHGTVLPITRSELNRLQKKWPSPIQTESAADKNPVIKGYYADPEILYSNKTKKFYLYPTTDGFTGWSGTFFKAFSSPDLKDWKDEGVILDLVKDVSWAKRNAWAPTIAERVVNGQYKYFYYFTAGQKIGVAVSDNPAGPFIDSGKPLIYKRPNGVKGGQEIDPDVFKDPKTGKSYLYWGNGYLAVAELNANMTQIDTLTTKVLKTNESFREGTEVFYRKGKYYFMWSADDTRSENYHVRYGMADSPVGTINIPDNNVVISKDAASGIYATGHNSVVQIPGKDEWYIVYHRFGRPLSIGMGEAAGYHREVCIDRLKFNSDGTIQRVIPTLKGIN